MELDRLRDPLEFGRSDRPERDVAGRHGSHDLVRRHDLSRCRGAPDTRSEIDRAAKDVAVAQD